MVDLRLSLALLGVAFAVVVGVPPEARADAGPLEGWWRVASVGGAPLPPLLQARATAVFREDGFSGRDTCNWYWGSSSRSGATLRLKVEGMTTMACRWTDGIPSIENQLQALLGRTERFERHGDHLALIAADGERIELVRAPETDRIQALRDPHASPEERALVDPQFERRPTREQLLASFERPGPRGGAARVQIVCAATPLGDIADCRVSGGSSIRGADAAALVAARHFRLTRADAALVRRHRVSVLLNVEFPSASPELPQSVR